MAAMSDFDFSKAPDAEPDHEDPAPTPESDAPETDEVEEPSTMAAPAPPSTTAAIYIEDHQFTVEVDGVEDHEEDYEPEPAEIDPRDTKALQDLISAETDRKAALQRPFYHVDTESLLVLQNALREELSGR